MRTRNPLYAALLIASAVCCALGITLNPALAGPGGEARAEGESEKGKDSSKEKKKASEKDKDKTAKKSTGQNPNEKFCVVQIGEDLKIIRVSEVKAAQKKVSDDYENALNEFNKAKQDAAKNKTKFTRTKPVRKSFKVVAGGISGEDAAKKRLEELKNLAASKKKDPKKAAGKEKDAEGEKDKKDPKAEGGAKKSGES